VLRVFVTGTGTDVGKTWVAASALARLRGAGRRVAARKPAQSFAPDDARTDADVLADATGEVPATVCPPAGWLPVPMAPPMAAAVLGRPVPTLHDLLDRCRAPAGTDLLLVEGAGGPRSPIAADGDNVDLARLLVPDVVVLVADAGLGTINAVRLSAGALTGQDVIVVLNRYDATDDLHRRNAEWLAADGLAPVIGPDPLVARLLARLP